MKVWHPWSSAFAILQVGNLISGANHSVFRLLDTLTNHSSDWFIPLPPKFKARRSYLKSFRNLSGSCETAAPTAHPRKFRLFASHAPRLLVKMNNWQKKRLAC